MDHPEVGNRAAQNAVVIDGLLKSISGRRLGDKTFSEFCERTPKELLLAALPVCYQT